MFFYSVGVGNGIDLVWTEHCMTIKFIDVGLIDISLYLSVSSSLWIRCYTSVRTRFFL